MKYLFRTTKIKLWFSFYTLLPLCLFVLLVFLFFGFSAMDENEWFLANFIEGPWWAFLNLMIVHLDFFLMVSPTFLLIASHKHRHMGKVFLLVFLISFVVLNLQPDLGGNGHIATGIVLLILFLRSFHSKVFIKQKGCQLISLIE